MTGWPIGSSTCPHLFGVAYRMLGSASDAEDAVQEGWLRLSRTDTAAVENLGGWLTTVVGRVCLDMLRARAARREQDLGGSPPEPIVTLSPQDDPEHQALMADSVGLALLVVLDTLSPPERLAFVLHDMFAVPFDEIAEMLDRTPAAARQLASRGRRRVRGAAPTPDADIDTQREVVDAFVAAARAGDFDALVEVLHPDVIVRSHTGRRPTQTVTGAENVARRAMLGGRRFAPLARPALVNGAAGFVLLSGDDEPVAAIGFTVTGGRIATIDLVSDPERLAGLAADR